MSEPYKLPRCFVGQSIEGVKVITEDMCNPDCHCFTPMAAMFCMEGHMTECHAGMTCDEAECSHLERYQDPIDDQMVNDRMVVADAVQAMDDESLMRACDVEMQNFHEAHSYVEIRIRITDLFPIIGALQLALRHPGLVGMTREKIEIFVEHFARELRDYPALTELIRRGRSTPEDD